MVWRSPGGFLKDHYCCINAVYYFGQCLFVIVFNRFLWGQILYVSLSLIFDTCTFTESQKHKYMFASIHNKSQKCMYNHTHTHTHSWCHLLIYSRLACWWELSHLSHTHKLWCVTRCQSAALCLPSISLSLSLSLSFFFLCLSLSTLSLHPVTSSSSCLPLILPMLSLDRSTWVPSTMHLHY